MPYNRPDLLEAGLRAARPRAGRRHRASRSTTTPAASCRRRSSCDALRAADAASTASLLIFDEVLSAFRMGPGGAQEYLGVTPDLCTLGKAVGGGYPAERLRRPQATSWTG